VEALVEPPNAASRRTLESSGFRREGLLRSYVLLGGRRLPSRRADVLMYSLLPTDLREPGRPVPDEP
jgi:RimJ/RimL family protein N-acetyltransferase